MMAKLLNYLVSNRLGAMIGLVLSQFLPIISSFSVILQSFYIINKGVTFTLPLIIITAIFNQFSLPLFMGDEAGLVGFMIAFLTAHLLLIFISAFFAWSKSFEYTSVMFALSATVIFIVFREYYGFEDFKQFILANVQVELTDEMIADMMAMVFLSYSFLSLVFAILLQNKYFEGNFSFGVGKVYLFVVLGLSIARLSGIIEPYAVLLFGSAVVISAINEVYGLVKSINRYSNLIIVALSILATMYLEWFVYLAIGFGLWNFFGKKYLSRG